MKFAILLMEVTEEHLEEDMESIIVTRSIHYQSDEDLRMIEKEV